MPLPMSEKGAETSLKRKETECQVLKYGINEKFLKSPINILETILPTLLCAFLLCSHF